MNNRQPPRYKIENQTNHNIVFFERDGSQQFRLQPMKVIYFESEIENEHFPLTTRGSTVKLHVRVGDEMGGFYLHPGEHGMRLKSHRLLVNIQELGLQRAVTITDVSVTQNNTTKMETVKHELSIGIKTICLILMNEIAPIRQPVISITAEGIFVAVFEPRNVKNDGDNIAIHVSAEYFSIENQLYQQFEEFDFPVILSTERNRRTEQNVRTLEEEAQLLSTSDPVSISIIFNRNGNWIRDLSCRCPTAKLFIEDVFVIRLSQLLMEYQSSVVPSATGNSNIPTQTDLDFNIEVESLRSTIFIEKLDLAEVNILVSAKANIKLYVGADSSSIRLAKFELNGTRTCLGEIMRSLKMHYIYEGIKRAGWVVGSLELIGSPAGLVRAIGAGLSDLVFLPVAGARRGPGGFISGAAGGAHSLAAHVGAAMLTSITNIAGSLSRNMDSLATEASTRSNARQRPVHFSQGLAQGLSHFGMSMLGSIAGLVQHPLDAVVAEIETENNDPIVLKTSRLAMAAGKGVLGLFVKPIGGFTGLVSKTGQGLLSSSGLCQKPLYKRCPISDRRFQHISRQFFKTLTSLDIFIFTQCSVPSPQQDRTDSIAAWIVLTKELLYIIDETEFSIIASWQV